MAGLPLKAWSDLTERAHAAAVVDAGCRSYLPQRVPPPTQDHDSTIIGLCVQTLTEKTKPLIQSGALLALIWDSVPQRAMHVRTGCFGHAPGPDAAGWDAGWECRASTAGSGGAHNARRAAPHQNVHDPFAV